MEIPDLAMVPLALVGLAALGGFYAGGKALLGALANSASKRLVEGDRESALPAPRLPAPTLPEGVHVPRLHAPSTLALLEAARREGTDATVRAAATLEDHARREVCAGCLDLSAKLAESERARREEYRAAIPALAEASAALRLTTRALNRATGAADE